MGIQSNCGVYKIVNKANGKVYIGSSRDLKKRFRSHKSMLKCGTHYNIHLQRAFEKYGEKSFSFKVVEYTNEEQRWEREQQLIDKYKACDGERGYNISPVAKGPCLKGKNNGMYGKTHSKKTREVLRRKNSGANNAHSKSVIQLDMTGKLIAEFDSVRQAAEKTGLWHSGIAGSCRGKYKHSGGYIWIYKDKNHPDYISRRVENAKKEKVFKPRDDRIPIIQLTKDFRVIKEFPSMYQAAKETGLDLSSICACCKEKQKTCGGYVFVYKKDYSENYTRDLSRKRTNIRVV